jgi:hypothetical protein
VPAPRAPGLAGTPGSPGVPKRGMFGTGGVPAPGLPLTPASAEKPAARGEPMFSGFVGGVGMRVDDGDEEEDRAALGPASLSSGSGASSDYDHPGDLTGRPR